MNLTFKGFLKMYLAELSGMQTTNIRRLVNAANTDTPRVAEPLFVYSVVANKLDYLLTNSEKTWMYKDYWELANKLRGKYKDIVVFLKSNEAPKRYTAVLDAFYAKDDILNSKRRILGQLRPKVESSLKKSGISKYKACKDLGINPGNFYAYMNGDDSKISEEIAYAVISYDDRGSNDKKFINKTITRVNINEFYERNGENYIDIKFSDKEFTILKTIAKEHNTNPEYLIETWISQEMNKMVNLS